MWADAGQLCTAAAGLSPGILVSPPSDCLEIDVYIGLAGAEILSVQSGTSLRVPGRLQCADAVVRCRQLGDSSLHPPLICVRLTAVGVLTLMLSDGLKVTTDRCKWTFQTALCQMLYSTTGVLLYTTTALALPLFLPASPRAHPVCFHFINVYVCFTPSEALHDAQFLVWMMLSLWHEMTLPQVRQMAEKDAAVMSSSGYYSGRLTADEVLRLAKSTTKFCAAVCIRLTAIGFLTLTTNRLLEITSNRERWRFYMPLRAMQHSAQGTELYRLVPHLASTVEIGRGLLTTQ